MKKLILIMAFLFAHDVRAEEMPGINLNLSTTITPSLSDEIAFEKEKLVTYPDAVKASRGNRLPLVVCVGCYVDDIQLFLQLKGKVILCYLPAKTTPFPTLESGVVVGLWNGTGDTCVRHDVAAYTFSDPKFRESLLFSKTLPSKTEVLTMEQFNQLYGGQVITGYTCTNGVCTPNYGPPASRFQLRSK
jgi:hypothetical protein